MRGALACACIFACILSFQAAAKKAPGKKVAPVPEPATPQQMADQAKSLAIKGDLQGAKKLYDQLAVKHGGIPVGGPIADDLDFGGALAVNTYADLARHELKFIELEMREGKRRLFTDPKKTLEDLATDIELGDFDELRAKMWVRMQQGPCGEGMDEMTPDEALEELKSEIEAKTLKDQHHSVGTSAAPAMRIALRPDRHIELRMAQHGKNWIWNQTIICARGF